MNLVNRSESALFSTAERLSTSFMSQVFQRALPFSALMSALSDSQRETLNTFRTDVFKEGILKEGDSIGTDDETLLRFLRARKFNLPQSTKMLKDCQEWRKTAGGVGIDELYRKTDPFDYPEREDVFECWPMWFHKTDKHGRPLNFHFYGSMDTHKLYSRMTPERHWETFMVNCELLPREILPAASRKAGKPIGTVFVVVDLKGFGVTQFWQMKSLARGAFQISQDYYPETMGKVTIINAPSSFAYIFSIMKPWMAPETRQKISILGHNYLEELLQDIDEDALPSILGGKCTCADHGGCALSGAGPWQDGRKGWGPLAKAREAAANGTAPAPNESSRPSSPKAPSVKSSKEEPSSSTNGDAHPTTSKEAPASLKEEKPVNGAAADSTPAKASLESTDATPADLPPSSTPSLVKKPSKRTSWFGSLRG